MAPQRATRDRFVDLLRTCSMLVVVLGHWLMPVLALRGGVLTTGNALTTPGWWLLTWPLQVMPVFFFVGGAANFHSYTAHLGAGGNTLGWLAARLRRFVIPVLPLLVVWLPLPGLLRVLGVPGQPVEVAAGVVGQLLWFLAVYVLCTMLVPALLAARARWGWAVLPVLACCAIGVDALRFAHVPYVGYANELFVWLALQQLGVEYATGRLAGLGRRGAGLLAAGGFAATALLVAFGPYPASMVGLPGAAVSNMAPATVCLLTLGCGQVGVLLVLRDRLVAATHRPAIAALLRTVGPRCLTLYLWHMTALVLVAGIAVLGFGYHTPNPGSLGWILELPLWYAALAVVLRGLLAVFGRFETMRFATPSLLPTAALAVAVVLVTGGLTGLAAHGFTGQPWPWAAALVAGLGLTFVEAPAMAFVAAGSLRTPRRFAARRDRRTGAR